MRFYTKRSGNSEVELKINLIWITLRSPYILLIQKGNPGMKIQLVDGIKTKGGFARNPLQKTALGNEVLWP